VINKEEWDATYFALKRIAGVVEDFQQYRKNNKNVTDKLGKLERTFDTSNFLNEQRVEKPEADEENPAVPA
jgi:hypothetical protein